LDRSIEAQEHSELALPPDGNVGLARGYTAMGGTAKAIAKWEIALKNIPESQQANREIDEQGLQKIKQQ